MQTWKLVTSKVGRFAEENSDRSKNSQPRRVSDLGTPCMQAILDLRSPAVSMNKFQINFRTISALYEARRKPSAISEALTRRQPLYHRGLARILTLEVKPRRRLRGRLSSTTLIVKVSRYSKIRGLARNIKL